MEVSVVSRTASLYEGSAQYVAVPTREGEIGFLKGHEPVLGVLGEGKVRLTELDGTVRQIYVNRGIYSIDDDIVTVACLNGELIED